MRKPEKTTHHVSSDLPMPDGEFAASYPMLTEYMTCTKWEDDSPRTVSALSLFVEDNVLKLALNDKHNKRSLYVASDSVEGLFRLMEMLVQTSAPPWRAWNAGKKKS